MYCVFQSDELTTDTYNPDLTQCFQVSKAIIYYYYFCWVFNYSCVYWCLLYHVTMVTIYVYVMFVVGYSIDMVTMWIPVVSNNILYTICEIS